MSGWFCRSGFGPRPFSGTNWLATKGSAAGVVTSSRKNESIAKRIASAVVASRGSVRVARQATKAAAPARISVQSRIEPSSAAQSEMTL